MPEVASTLLSMKLSSPAASAPLPLWALTRTGTLAPPAAAARSAGRSRSGRVKLTRSGFICVMVTSPSPPSADRTMLPSVTRIAPSLPSIGARTCGVIEADSVHVDGRLIGLDVCRRDLRVGIGLVDLLLRRDLAREEVAGTRGVRLRPRERGLIAGEQGLVLRKRRADLPIVDTKQQVVAMYVLALLDELLHDLAVDAGADGDAGHRLDPADGPANCRHILDRRRGGDDGSTGRFRRRAHGLGRLALGRAALRRANAA